jgi:formiminotetrahydrofolate cyclodeaminase
MAYRTETLETYLADASADRPTPGGGSASAAAGALGAAMACMAANFTLGRPEYEDNEPKVRELLAVCEAARQAMLAAVDEDVTAYGKVSTAYAMPRNTDEEEAARRAAVQAGLKAAMGPPMDTFRACVDCLLVLEELADVANPNLVSDVGVAAALLLGALEGASLNVEINLAYLKDEALAASTRSKLETNGGAARDAARKTLDKVTGRIRE